MKKRIKEVIIETLIADKLDEVLIAKETARYIKILKTGFVGYGNMPKQELLEELDYVQTGHLEALKDKVAIIDPNDMDVSKIEL